MQSAPVIHHARRLPQHRGVYYVVRGTAPKGVTVRLFVHAADERWYIQAPTTRHGQSFSGHFVLGGDIPRLPSYEVVAVACEEHEPSPSAAPPAGPRSSHRFHA